MPMMFFEWRSAIFNNKHMKEIVRWADERYGI